MLRNKKQKFFLLSKRLSIFSEIEKLRKLSQLFKPHRFELIRDSCCGLQKNFKSTYSDDLVIPHKLSHTIHHKCYHQDCQHSSKYYTNNYYFVCGFFLLLLRILMLKFHWTFSNNLQLTDAHISTSSSDLNRQFSFLSHRKVFFIHILSSQSKWSFLSHCLSK